MTSVYEVSKDNFTKEVIECELPVLVDFYSEGCGPCEVISPILDEISVDYEGKIKITKFYVKIEEVLELTNDVVNKYEVMGFPTLLIFKDGNVIHTQLGGLHREELIKFLDSALV